MHILQGTKRSSPKTYVFGRGTNYCQKGRWRNKGSN